MFEPEFVQLEGHRPTSHSPLHRSLIVLTTIALLIERVCLLVAVVQEQLVQAA